MHDPVQTLHPLRFQCVACGACCQGVRAELEDAEEAARIRRIAEEMGVDEPIVDGFLRQENGMCPFLAADGRCGIHARYGGEAKPLVCQQFPYVVLDTESGMRAGVDPTPWRPGTPLRPTPTKWENPAGRTSISTASAWRPPSSPGAARRARRLPASWECCAVRRNALPTSRPALHPAWRCA
ncbi:MAG: YkgJ family cysteine cluster protein [Deltaproteobacteria bacterium]|nr:YkgJ family cysteine cluster protein [Deltaproteobacteria bacterium]